MAKTTEHQDITLNPPQERVPHSTLVRPRPASWAVIAALSLPLQSAYSQFCYESENGSWVRLPQELQSEAETLEGFELLEVAA